MTAGTQAIVLLLLLININLGLSVETTLTTELTATEKQQKTCAHGEACYLKVGSSLLDCNMTEDKNYRHLPYCSNYLSYVTSFNYSEFKNELGNAVINISGEFEIDFTPTHILIMYNPGNVPFEGKFYLLTVSLEKGKKNFHIDCLDVTDPSRKVKQARACVSVILLYVTKENFKEFTTAISGKLKTDSVCNKSCLTNSFSRIELQYDVKKKELNIKIKKMSSSDSYAISLLRVDDEKDLHCEQGQLLWHNISHKTEFNIFQENTSGLFCIKILWRNYSDQRLFKLKDVIPSTDVSFTKPNISLGIYSIVVRSAVELKIKSNVYCHLPLHTLHICLYTDNVPEVCKNETKDDLWKNKTCVLHELHSENLVTLTFPHLSPGNYCAKVYPVHRTCKHHGICYNGVFSKTITLEGSRKIEPEIQHMEPDSPKIVMILFITLAIIIGLTIVFIFLYLKVFRPCITRTGAVNEVVQITNTEIEDWKLSRIRIFLLYSYERSKMDDIVLKFIQILEECFFCQVIHIMNECELDRAITQTPSGWVLSNLHQADKIIIIESQKAYEMQRHWINSQIIELSCNEELVFLSGLVTIQNKQLYNNDYDQLIVVRFCFTPSCIALQDVVENCRFILPSCLPDLFFKIHGKRFINNNNDNKGQFIIRPNAENLVAEWENNTEVYSDFVKECNSTN